MPEHDDPAAPPNEGSDASRRTTQEQRDRAAAVHSIPDDTRAHTDADETDLVKDAGGELRQPDNEEE